MNINELSLEQKIGQVLIAGFPTSDPDDPRLYELMTKHKIGNVIYFLYNVKSKDDVIRLNKRVQQYAMENSGIPAFISVDQEGGMVSRIFYDDAAAPGAMATAATGNSDFAKELGRIFGQELNALGFNLNFAPVLDVNNNPDNPVIGVRSYSDDPKKVAEYACKFIKGMQAEGVIATGKHFPGHGDTAVDSHIDLPCVPHSIDRLKDVELYPFVKAVEAGIDAIMTTHILFPSIEQIHIPATLSKRILTDMLREQMGYKGLIITDCMEMNAIKDHYGTSKSAAKALIAGADLVIISHTIELQAEAVKEIKAAIMSGELKEERLNDAVSRVLNMKQKYSLFDKQLSDKSNLNEVDFDANKRLAADISLKSITLVKDEEHNLPIKKSSQNVFISPESTVLIKAESDGTRLNFSKYAAKHFGGRSITCSISPDEIEIGNILSAVNADDTVVIATYNAGLNHGQAMLLKQLYEKHNNIIMISLRNPYDYNVCPLIKTYVCAYEYTRFSIESVIAVLSGEEKAKGVLPVRGIK